MSPLMLIFFLLISFNSCASVSHFIKNGKTNALVLVGEEGDTVVYVNLRNNRDLYAKKLKVNKKDLSRFLDCIIVINKSCVYGIIEGDIPHIARDTIAKRLAAKKTKSNGIECFEKKIDDKTTVLFNLVQDGLILFSVNCDFDKVYSTFISKPSEKMQKMLSDALQSHDAGIFAISPSLNKIDMFKEDVLKGGILALDYLSDKNRIKLNGVFEFKNMESLKVFETKMKSEIIKYMKNKGSTQELFYALMHCKFSHESLTIEYNDYDMPYSMLTMMAK